MKVSTFCFLAAMGMGATSATVVMSAPAPEAASPAQVAVGATDPAAAEAGAEADAETPAEASPAPASFTAEGTLTLHGRLGSTIVAADRPGEALVMATVSADATARTAAPADVAIVIDRSGSMKGAPMRNALDAAKGMIRRMRDGDRVSIVTYNGAAETVLGSIALTRARRDLIARTLDEIRAGGNTCISCGIEQGLAALEVRSGAVRRMLLLSDGEANRGVTDIARFRDLAARARAREVAISSIGVDLEYNERLLSELAQMSNGMHHFVEDSRQLGQAFDKELQTLATTVADQARVELTLADGVRMLEIADREFSIENGRVLVPLGSFSPGETKTVLMRVELPARGVGDHAVADMKLDFFDRVVGVPSALEGALLARAIDGDVPKTVDPVVAARDQRSTTIAALREANDSLSVDKPDAALGIIETARRKLKKRRTAASAAPAAAADIDRQLGELDNAFENISENRTSEKGRKRAKKLNQAAINPLAF